MIINQLSGEGKSGGETCAVVDLSEEYQTANELFELMARNYDFVPCDNESLTTSDLVLLYKNIDLGTQLMTNAKELKRKVPNQHVETVVYNEDGDSEDSDVSDVYSTEELRNIFLINQERMDFLNNRSSFENTVCHKFGNTDIKLPSIGIGSRKNFVLKNAINDQLKTFNLTAYSNISDDSILPASLLDYICCKDLEDNYSVYMDNIITHVRHTIEQLKRISNGDYLTDKAREKWREVEYMFNRSKNKDSSKVLATSTSIPLHLENQLPGRNATWDDIPRSEIDVRYLSKILEKKIGLQVPKLIYGTYKLFSNSNTNNLLISYKKDNKQKFSNKKSESRIDIHMKLKRSLSRQVVNAVKSVVVLKTSSNENSPPSIFSLTYNENNISYQEETKIIKNNNVQVVELYEDEENQRDITQETTLKINREDTSSLCIQRISNFDFETENVYNEIAPVKEISQINTGDTNITCQELIESGICVQNALSEEKQNLCSGPSFSTQPEELSLSMQGLSIFSLPEESGDDTPLFTCNRKKSSVIRVKSPYENKRFLMDEKRRKKLLEIRERREKRKIMNEHNKISRLKHGIVPRASNSVTNLSITNKSFYNSIYGTETMFDKKQRKTKSPKKLRRNRTTGISLIRYDNFPNRESENIIETRRHISRNICFDDITDDKASVNVSEIIQIQRNNIDATNFEDTSVNSSDLKEINSTEHINLSSTSPHVGNIVTTDKTLNEPGYLPERNSKHVDPNPGTINKTKTVPRERQYKNAITSVECRKDIDKIYDLIKTNQMTKSLEKNTQNKYKNVAPTKNNLMHEQENYVFPASDSGTSLKHNPELSSNPSSFSFNKMNCNVAPKQKSMYRNVGTLPAAVPPKVVINSKARTQVPEDKAKRENKKVTVATPVKTEDPLKTISHLLHVFENVQKSRHKTTTEVKTIKKPEDNFVDNRGLTRNKRPITLEQPVNIDKFSNDKHLRKIVLREKKPKLMTDVLKLNSQKTILIDKQVDNVTKRKVDDIIDEVKEAKGEAVRGPQQNSRIYSLAQPKRSYVQAHNEEYQMKYGRSIVTDRLQRLAVTFPPPSEKTVSYAGVRGKQKGGTGEVPALTTKPPSPKSTSEKTVKRKIAAVATPNWKPYKPPSIAEPPTKQNNTEGHLSPKKKSVAVEPYVRFSERRPRGVSVNRGTESESSAVGTKNSHVNPMVHLEENELDFSICKKIPSCIREEIDNLSVSDNVTRCEAPPSTDSDFVVDIFKDKTVLTAVENMVEENNHEDKINESFSEDTNKSEIQSVDSETEMEKLENALYRQISIGTFQKRLRIKNLTLAPKHSVQKILVLQSGDAKSIVAEPSMPLKITATNSGSEKLPDIKDISILPRTCLDWNLAGSPMQIATVGYAFSQLLHPIKSKSYSNSNSTYIIDSKSCFCIDNASFDDIQIRNKKSREVFRCIKVNKQDLELKHRPQNLHQFRERIENLPNKAVDYNVDNKADLEYRDEHVVNILHSINTKFDKAVEVYDNESQHEVQETSYRPKETVESKTKQLKLICDDILRIPDPDYEAETKFQKKTKEFMQLPLNILSTTKDLDSKTNEENTAFKRKTLIESNSEDIEYTASLDILVGLLNEIQNITTCQNDMTKAAAHDDNNTVVQQNNKVNDLEHLKLYPQISLCVPNPQGEIMEKKKINTSPRMTSKLDYPKTIAVTKEIVLKTKYINTYTDVPSQFLSNVDHSTSVTSSLMKLLNTPSKESTALFTEYQTLYSNLRFNSRQSTMDLPHIEITEQLKNSLVNFNNFEKYCNKGKEKNEKYIGTKQIDIKSINTKYNAALIPTRDDKNSYESPEIIKIKRDILVTVYSILVFTVFAALSFPELLNRM